MCSAVAPTFELTANPTVPLVTSSAVNASAQISVAAGVGTVSVSGVKFQPYVKGQVGANTVESSTSLTTSLTTDTTQGNTIIATVKLSFGDTISSITDTRGNTWSVDASSGGSASTSYICSAYLATALTTADSVTVNCSGSNNLSVQLLEAVGVSSSSALDQHAGTFNSASGTISATTSATAQTYELAITTAGNGNIGPSTWTPPTGWNEVPSGISNPNFIDSAWQTMIPQGDASATWGSSVGASTNLSIAIATYRSPQGAVTANAGVAVVSVLGVAPVPEVAPEAGTALVTATATSPSVHLAATAAIAAVTCTAVAPGITLGVAAAPAAALVTAASPGVALGVSSGIGLVSCSGISATAVFGAPVTAGKVSITNTYPSVSISVASPSCTVTWIIEQ